MKQNSWKKFKQNTTLCKTPKKKIFLKQKNIVFKNKKCSFYISLQKMLKFFFFSNPGVLNVLFWSFKNPQKHHFWQKKTFLSFLKTNDNLNDDAISFSTRNDEPETSRFVFCFEKTKTQRQNVVLLSFLETVPITRHNICRWYHTIFIPIKKNHESYN